MTIYTHCWHFSGNRTSVPVNPHHKHTRLLRQQLARSAAAGRYHPSPDLDLDRVSRTSQENRTSWRWLSLYFRLHISSFYIHSIFIGFAEHCSCYFIPLKWLLLFYRTPSTTHSGKNRTCWWNAFLTTLSECCLTLSFLYLKTVLLAEMFTDTLEKITFWLCPLSHLLTVKYHTCCNDNIFIVNLKTSHDWGWASLSHAAVLHHSLHSTVSVFQGIPRRNRLSGQNKLSGSLHRLCSASTLYSLHFATPALGIFKKLKSFTLILSNIWEN